MTLIEKQPELAAFQILGSVLPELTSGDHAIAEMLAGAKDLQLAENDPRHPNNLLVMAGEHEQYGRFYIRLYGSQKLVNLGLQLSLRPPALEGKLRFNYSGGVLNSMVDGLYGDLAQGVNFYFDFSRRRQFALQAYGQSTKYKHYYQFNSPDAVHYQGFIFSGYDVQDNIARITIARVNNPAVALSLPAKITRLDMNSLPKINC